MSIVDVDAIPEVALAFMNEDHAVEARLLNQLGAALAALRAGSGTAGAVLERFAALDAHTREHFAREEAAMERAHFPPAPVHRAEHEMVLHEMADEGRRFRESGDAERLWAYVSQAVPAWFVGHIQSMDAVTARFVARQGG
jgi:hemerythrin